MMMMILSMTFSGHCHDYAFRNRYRCHGLLPAMNDPLPATRAPRGCCACDGSTATPRGSRRSPCARTRVGDRGAQPPRSRGTTTTTSIYDPPRSWDNRCHSVTTCNGPGFKRVLVASAADVRW